MTSSRSAFLKPSGVFLVNVFLKKQCRFFQFSTGATKSGVKMKSIQVGKFSRQVSAQFSAHFSAQFKNANGSLVGFAVLVAVSTGTFYGCQVKNPAMPSARITELSGPIIAVPSKPTPETAAKLVRSDYAKGELAQMCSEAIARAKSRVTSIISTKEAERTFDNTMLEYETAMADFSDEVSSLTFMKYVSPVASTHDEGADCEQKVSDFGVETSTNKALYLAIKSNSPRTRAEKRLADNTLLGFELSGMGLSDEQLKTFVELNKALNQKQNDYSENLTNDASRIEVTVEELAGVPQSFIDAAKRTADGKVIVNANSAEYPVIMRNCSNEKTRKSMMLTYLNRGADKNTKLLEEAIVLRQQIAALVTPTMKALGPHQRTWADYRISNRMARDKQSVLTFANDLKTKLALQNKADLDLLLKYKKEIEPTATVLNQWDIDFMANALTKRDYSVDSEKVREYFPADVVIDGLFSVYSELLSVNYKEVKDAKVWANDVKLYEIREKSDNRLIGYFYTDFYPRPGTGRYGHAAAFPLVSARMMGEGYYSLPVASIVANMSAPVNGRPALLDHDEVETLFHEFGHIMHQTLTRAPYASLSGSSVAQDFVEAPSQMLENWVWQPEVLNRLSGHHQNHNEKLPKELLEKMIAARDFQQGRMYTKQLLYGLFDMTIHTQSGPVDVTQTYDNLYKEIMGVAPIEGGHFAASFGHMMGGYDAGYYGYLWSKVYAQDMFSIFKAQGTNSPVVGGRYRSTILERGNMQDAIQILEEFLGRPPENKAFFEDLHI